MNDALQRAMASAPSLHICKTCKGAVWYEYTNPKGETYHTQCTECRNGVSTNSKTAFAEHIWQAAMEMVDRCR